ncbi:MAG: hypothetical protein K6G60_03320 [Lachnospiraceae bacterium]|nr:hypothetical protein [Lachnospiraceae bacterium]
MLSKIEWIAERDKAWNEYAERERKNPARLDEIQNKRMDFGEVTMRYGISVIGEPDEKGYPLYIAMHGGGGSPTPDINNQQWEHMGIYYKNSVKRGVYVNTRGVRDTWDCHGNPESFPLYDRLIENMILFYNVDPNRVYFLGFSAGGDGVYICAPRMADRLAAANMSAGHHNGTSVWNMRNTPLQLQVGELDGAYGRNLVTVDYQVKLDEYARKYGGYVHNTFVHFGKPHNFYDNHGDELQEVIKDVYKWHDEAETSDEKPATVKADTDAVHFLDRYKRNPYPERIVWDLKNRAPMRRVESFYWLSCPKDVQEGFIVADIDKKKNKITILPDTTAKEFDILLNDDLLDLDDIVRIETPNGGFEGKIERKKEEILKTLNERGDKDYIFSARYHVNI